MNLAVSMLPMGLTAAAGLLIGKDADNTGADDAIGQICMALAPVIPDLIGGGTSNGNAVLKAMRAIEQTAHSYRVQVNDPTLTPSS